MRPVPLTLLLCGLSCAVAGGDLTLTVLHTNDVHSHFLETDPFGGRCKPENKNRCVGGAARHLFMVRKFRRERENVLFLNAGDYFQGTAWYTVLKYKPVADVVKLLNFNAMCLGNHEFDDGPAGLAPFLKEVEGIVPILASNVNFSGSHELKDLQVNKSIILNIGSKAVGIIGAVTPDTKGISSPGPGVTFTDDLKSIREEAIVLKQSGVHIIIALTHVGYRRDIEIAREIPEISLVVGGHSHSFLFTGDDHPKEDKPVGPYPTIVKRVDRTQALVVQAYWFGKYMGHIDVTFGEYGELKSWKGKPLLLNQSIPEDQAMLGVLQKYEPNVTASTKAVVGSSKVVLNADNGVCRREECNIGNFVADAFFEFFADKRASVRGAWSDVNGCIVNGGSIRGSIASGTVTRGDLMTVMPFSNTLVVVTLTGAQLWDLFEFSVENYNPKEPTGGFLQISGFYVSFDMTQPEMKRVTSVDVLCSNCSVPRYEPLDDRRVYKVVTVSYMYKGGDGYDFKHVINAADAGDLDYDAFERYLQKMSPVKAKIERRIKIVGADTWPPPRTPDAGDVQRANVMMLTVLAAFVLVL